MPIRASEISHGFETGVRVKIANLVKMFVEERHEGFHETVLDALHAAVDSEQILERNPSSLSFIHI